MRVFWPNNCLDGVDNSEDCLYVGWNNSDDDLVVVTALPYLDIELVAQLLEQDGLLGSDKISGSGGFLENAIRNTLLSPKKSSTRTTKTSTSSRTAFQLYSKFNHKRLCVVGTSKRHTLEQKVSKECLEEAVPPFDIIRVNRNRPHPYIEDRHGTPCLVIRFDPPDPKRMHYFTLEKNKLYDFSKTERVENRTTLHEELLYHTSSPTQKTDNWDVVIPQLNCVYDLQLLLRQNAGTMFPDLKKEPSLIKNYTSSPGSPKGHIPGIEQRNRSKSFIQPRLKCLQLMVSLRSMVEVCLQILETSCIGNTNLISLFCTAQQIDLRLNQLCYLPHEYIAITRRSQQDWHWLTPDRNEAYIRFNNYIWLGLNDLIIGGYFLTLIHAYSEDISKGIITVLDMLCSEVVNVTHWLMSWPAGLKLNTQLAQFIGDVTIWIICTWHSCLSAVFTPAITRSVVSIIGISGIIGGATLQISLIIDVFSVFSFHLYLLYQLLARVYSQQFSVLMSLFRVFRGRKYNVLRKRVDHGDYDVHQLLLGTILFTVVLFLFPTILTFYAFFALARLAVLGFIGILCMWLAFLNYFPLFPLLLRVKSPRRVPSGITFTKMERKSTDSTLSMRTKSMQLREIFFQFLDTSSHFMNDLFNFDTAKELCTGKVVNIQQSKLYASLYSMLPNRRGSARLLFVELCDYLGLKQST